MGFFGNLLGSIFGRPKYGEDSGNSVSDSIFGSNGLFTNPSGAWDEFMNGKTNSTNLAQTQITNDTNKAIADQNLAFQRDNLDYQKQLQQKIFDREDTAYQRTASDMSAAGLNPLAMSSTNGAGEAIQTDPLHNDFQRETPHLQGAGIGQALAPMLSMLTSVQDMAHGNLERDSLRLENERKKLENMVFAHKNGLKIASDGNWSFGENAPYTDRERDKSSVERGNRVNEWQQATGMNDMVSGIGPVESTILTAASALNPANSSSGSPSDSYYDNVLKSLKTSDNPVVSAVGNFASSVNDTAKVQYKKNEVRRSETESGNRSSAKAFGKQLEDDFATWQGTSEAQTYLENWFASHPNGKISDARAAQRAYYNSKYLGHRR